MPTNQSTTFLRNVLLLDAAACHPGRSAAARRAGTQGRCRLRQPLGPGYFASRNSGMTALSAP